MEGMLASKKIAYNPIMKFFTSNIELFLFAAAVMVKASSVNKYFGIRSKPNILYLSNLGMILVLAGICMLFKRRTRITLLILSDLAVSIIMIADILFYRYYNDVVTTPVFGQAKLMNTLQDSILSLFNIKDLFFVLDIIVFTVIFIFLFKKSFFIKTLKFRFRFISTISLLLVGALCITYSFIHFANKTGKNVFTSIHDHSFFVAKLGIINFHGFDVYTAITNRISAGKAMPQEQVREVKSYFDNKTPQAAKNQKLYGIAKDKNVIVLQVEALDNFVINLEVEGKEVTPNLNKLVKRSMYFDNYYSQTAQGNTSDAEFVSNTSFYPLPEGSVYFRCAKNDFESMPNVLKSHGYSTEVSHAFTASYWNRATMYPVLGFDEFISSKDLRHDDPVVDKSIGWGLNDKSFLMQSLENMKKLTQPFYSFMITLTSHFPYNAFQDDMEYDAGKFNKTFFGNYLKSIHYTDAAIGSFIEGLEKDGLLDKSVVVIYGDHSAVQKDKLDDIKGFLGFNQNNDIGYLQAVKVPLIIHLPEDKEAGIRNITGGQVDLFPTLANLLGIDLNYYMGRDMVNYPEGIAIFRDGSFAMGDVLYLKTYDECFSAKTGKKLGTEKYMKYIEQAGKHLDISDKVLVNNLVPSFEKLEENK